MVSYSVYAIGLSLLLGLYFYEDITNNDILENCSDNLKKWHAKGQYFEYKQLYKIFYIHELVDVNNEATLVLLHGFPTSSYDYSKIWNLFKHLKVGSILAFDYVGYGFSEKPFDYDYSLFDMADMVDSLLVHLNIQNNVYFISHDMGDSVLQELIRRATLNNQNHFKISQAVLLNGAIMTDIIKPTLGQHLLRIKFVNKLVVNFFFKYQLMKPSFSSIFGSLNKPSSSELYDFYLTIRYNNGYLNLPKTIQYMTEREHYGHVWYDALNETSIPCMFIFGPADPINPREKFISKFKIDLPTVKLAILSDLIGHYPQYEDPFTVFELVKSFFALDTLKI